VVFVPCNSVLAGHAGLVDRSPASGITMRVRLADGEFQGGHSPHVTENSTTRLMEVFEAHRALVNG
jgi:hypothetical protein